MFLELTYENTGKVLYLALQGSWKVLKGVFGVYIWIYGKSDLSRLIGLLERFKGCFWSLHMNKGLFLRLPKTTAFAGSLESWRGW